MNVFDFSTHVCHNDPHNVIPVLSLKEARSSKVDVNASEQTASVLLYSSSGQLGGYRTWKEIHVRFLCICILI